MKVGQQERGHPRVYATISLDRPDVPLGDWLRPEYEAVIILRDDVQALPVQGRNALEPFHALANDPLRARIEIQHLDDKWRGSDDERTVCEDSLSSSVTFTGV